MERNKVSTTSASSCEHRCTWHGWFQDGWLWKGSA